MDAPARPLLVYDGDCGFCLRWIERWRLRSGERVDFAPYEEVGARFPEVSVEEFRRSVWLFEPDGRRTRAAEAVLRSAAAAGGAGRLGLWLYRVVPGVRPVLEGGYRWVAEHRAGLLRVEHLLVGRDVVVSHWSRSRSVFRILLALAALIAFLSLRVQIDGLCGSHGITPVAPAMPRLAELEVPWWQFPTLVRLDASDAALHRMCEAGALLSALLLLDVAPALCALLVWALYLSLVLACNVFLSFQWDSLLVETCLVAALVLPWRLRPARRRRPDAPPDRLGRALLWWLLFRFMFESGVVKLTQDGNGKWHDLTALTYHYMTQPLPNGVSWYAWAQPAWLHQLSALGTFAIEIGVPFLIIGPRRVRHLACALLVLLQLLIGLTGNYGFFNVLTIALCLSLLDDQALQSIGSGLRWRRRAKAPASIASAAARAPAADAGPSCGLVPGVLPPFVPEPREPLVQRGAQALFGAVVLVVGLSQIHEAFAPREPFPIAAVNRLEAQLGPFLSINGYGLFRTMTLTRPEIIVQGSADGETWVDYDFRYKPDALDERPRWVEPHMPRLDWRLWFEALDWEESTQPLRPYDPSGWFQNFLLRLREGEPTVVGLLASNPFPEAPPRAVRATLYLYRFADADERRHTGQWWMRERIYPSWLQVGR